MVCIIWSYLQVSYILLREAYIANTRNDTSGTSGDSDKCNSLLFEFTYIQGNEWCDPLPHMHTHTHTRHTCTYTHTHVHDTHARTHTHKQLCQWDIFVRYDTQKSSLVARFSFPSLSVHTARNKMQSESRVTSTLHKIKGCIINRTILLLHDTNSILNCQT